MNIFEGFTLAYAVGAMLYWLSVQFRSTMFQNSATNVYESPPGKKLIYREHRVMVVMTGIALLIHHLVIPESMEGIIARGAAWIGLVILLLVRPGFYTIPVNRLLVVVQLITYAVMIYASVVALLWA